MNQTFRLDKMKPLDHPTIGIDDIQAFGSGIGKGSDDRLRFRNRCRIRAEMPIGGVDLRRMDQHLAGKAHGPALQAFGIETLLVPEILSLIHI